MIVIKVLTPRVRYISTLGQKDIFQKIVNLAIILKFYNQWAYYFRLTAESVSTIYLIKTI